MTRIKSTAFWGVLIITILFPSLLYAEEYEAKGVTCADGTHHPPGFDCEAYMRGKTGSDNSSVGVGIPLGYPQPDNRQQEWEKQQEREWLEKQQRDAEERKRRDAERRKQFEQDKQKALNMLKSGTGQLGLKEAPNSTGVPLKSTGQNDLKLKSYKESLYSRGTKNSAPVVLKSIPDDKPKAVFPEDMKMKSGAREKGLKTGYVPKPLLPSLADYHYDRKSRTDIIFDALEVGRGSYIKSIGHLAAYLAQVEPENVKVQEAMSYIQGMAEGEYIKQAIEKKKSAMYNGLFDPDAKDSWALLEDIPKPPEPSWWHTLLLSITPEEPVEPVNSPESQPIWMAARDSVVAEAAALLPEEQEKWTRTDMEKCVRYLETKKKKFPKDERIDQALQFFQGVRVYF